MARTTLSHLYDLRTRLDRLNGLNSDLLNATGFDDMLAELNGITTSVDQLRDVVSDLAGLDDALHLLLLLLTRAEDEQLGAMGLKNLLEPLCGGLRQQTERLSGLI